MILPLLHSVNAGNVFAGFWLQQVGYVGWVSASVTQRVRGAVTFLSDYASLTRPTGQGGWRRGFSTKMRGTAKMRF